MKKDIDLLAGFNESKNKKSAGNMGMILGVLVLIVIGVMVFFFVQGKMQIKEKEDILANLDQQLQEEVNITILEQKIESDKAKYKGMVTEILKEVYSGKVDNSAAEISSKFLVVLYDNYANQKDSLGQPKVLIEGLNVQGPNVTFSAKVKTYQDAWDFEHYLCGTLEVEPPSEYATDEEIAEYEERVAAIRKNAIYFSGVMESYPGLPEEPDGSNYDISLSVNIKVNWEAMADEIK